MNKTYLILFISSLALFSCSENTTIDDKQVITEQQIAEASQRVRIITKDDSTPENCKPLKNFIIKGQANRNSGGHNPPGLLKAMGELMVKTNNINGNLAKLNDIKEGKKEQDLQIFTLYATAYSCIH